MIFSKIAAGVLPLSRLTVASSIHAPFAPSLRHRSNWSTRRQLQTASTGRIVFSSRTRADKLVTYAGIDTNGLARFDVVDLPGGNTISAGAAFGDLDGDGHPDLIRASNNADDIAVIYNDGQDGFPGANSATIGKTASSKDYGVRLADVDRNGLLDVVTGSWNDGNFLHKQTSPGIFSTVQLPATTMTHYGFALADFNGDSYPDIVMSNQGGSAKVMMNDGFGGFPIATDLPTAPGMNSAVNMITEGDFDNDGDLDLVVACSPNSPDRLYVNDNGNFAPMDLPGTSSGGGYPFYYGAAAGFADLDGDGRLDIVIGSDGSPDRLYLNDGSGNYPAAADIPNSPTHTQLIEFGDIDGDGDIDMVVKDIFLTGYVFLNDGSAGFTVHTAVTGIFDGWGLAVLGGGSSISTGITISPTTSPSKRPTNAPTVSTETPTTSPSKRPTHVPTLSTETPTTSPSKSPTHAPTFYAPWEIHFLGLNANFTLSSVEEITIEYEIGRGHPFQAKLYQEDCLSEITDIDIISSDSTTNKNGTFDAVALSHSVDKAEIARSVIWDAAASRIDACQVVQLVESGMVIAEDKRILTIDFDLSVDYTVYDAALGSETINAGNDTTNVDGYVEACKCAGDGFVCNTDALVPNEDLHICIKSISPDILIDYLDDMTISQDGTGLVVIEADAAKFPSITSKKYVPAERGVVVKTRVPISMFDYNVPDATILIGGEVMMQLAGSRRMLQASSNSAGSVTGREEASFDFQVSLQRDMSSEEDEDLDDKSSACAKSSKSLVALGVVSVWTSAIMWCHVF